MLAISYVRAYLCLWRLLVEGIQWTSSPKVSSGTRVIRTYTQLQVNTSTQLKTDITLRLENPHVLLLGNRPIRIVSRTTLVIKNNILKQLPSELGNLVNLVSLDASRNKLQSLPPTIGDLIEFRALILDEPRIVDFPLEIGRLLNLQYFSLNDNPLSSKFLTGSGDLNDRESSIITRKAPLSNRFPVPGPSSSAASMPAALCSDLNSTPNPALVEFLYARHFAKIAH
ncbi:hypothetical protein FGIG_08558 [Fasciola gigantica]|uniref:Uncharacterized protein n=1 Tax=Fasciola gigantica TaxID=46835 RepID=A0A504XEU2_FASGI|nr:hypothetical protein FGIG_08558 [Fasciola gigantica]